MAILIPDHLLEQAERLLENRTQGRNPGLIRQVDRRRAISAAYYAVFHAILAEVADQFVGREHRKSKRYSLAYRQTDHSQIEVLARQVVRQMPEKKYQPYFPDGGFGEATREFALLLMELKRKRASADYDPSQWIQRADARTAIAEARRAIEQFKAVPSEERRIFLTLLAFPPR